MEGIDSSSSTSLFPFEWGTTFPDALMIKAGTFPSQTRTKEKVRIRKAYIAAMMGYGNDIMVMHSILYQNYYIDITINNVFLL